MPQSTSAAIASDAGCLHNFSLRLLNGHKGRILEIGSWRHCAVYGPRHMRGQEQRCRARVSFQTNWDKAEHKTMPQIDHNNFALKC
jgi:hypothetical protein